MNPWIGVGLVVAVLGGLLLAARPWTARLGGGPESARKFVHVGMGLVCLSFPWMFADSWPVLALAGIATLGLLAVRWIPKVRQGLGEALHGVSRTSFGELLFAPSVALVFQLAQGDRLLFVVPVLILTLADAAGAIAGTRWGKSRYGSGGSWKSVEGSTAFLFCAVICVALSLVLLSEVRGERLLWISLTIGLLAMMAEGLSDRGLDNLLLPVWVFFILERFLTMPGDWILIRFAALVGLLVLVVASGRFSTLDGGALLAAGLLGYSLGVLGGVPFVLPVLGLFAAHLLASCRLGLTGEMKHGVISVIGVAIATLPWAACREWLGGDVALLGCGLGSASMLVLLHAGTCRYLGQARWLGPGLWVKLVVLILAPLFLWLSEPKAIGIAAGSLVMALVMVLLERRIFTAVEDLRVWNLRGLLAFIASLPALALT